MVETAEVMGQVYKREENKVDSKVTLPSLLMSCCGRCDAYLFSPSQVDDNYSHAFCMMH